MTLLRRLWPWLLRKLNLRQRIVQVRNTWLALWRRERKQEIDRHPWNTPKQMCRRYTWANRPPPQKARLSRRERAKRRRKIKRFYGLTRSQCGAIGAGHMDVPADWFLAHWYVGL